MCGINGIIQQNTTTSSVLKNIRTMNSLITHRGPDDEGEYAYQLGNDAIAMGMRRLSIIDLQSGSQPMYNDDKTVAIVFNGEIYNYLALKKNLTEKNIKFTSQSDTEVILKIYEHYGVEGFKLLDGMFAFSILDRIRNKLIIARDYFGEKPLYYTQQNDQFVWASELKSIIQILPQQSINKVALQTYFQLTYIPAPLTIYNDIHKLPPNTVLQYNLNSYQYTIQPIHQKPDIEKIDISFNEAQNKTFQILSDSVASRSIADVPLGTFLSGGVDSSVVSWLLAQQSRMPIHTFSIGFKKRSFDESAKAREVAKLLGSYHNEFFIDENDLEQELDRVILNYDEPFADSSALATYIVSKEACKYMKVALTGDGGDEVFGGYNKYVMGHYNQLYIKYIPRSLHNVLKKITNSLKKKNDDRGIRFKLNKGLQAITYDNSYYENIISLGFPKESLDLLFFSKNREGSWITDRINEITPSPKFTLTDYQLVDRFISLEGDMLPKVDRASMLASIETRAPFLNRELWEFTLQLPQKYLLNRTNKKYLLKKTFEPYFPAGFLEKTKQGFGVPVGDWLRSSLKNELLGFVDKNFLTQQAIFNVEYCNKIVLNHISGKQDNTFKVWTFYVFQKWYVNQIKFVSY